MDREENRKNVKGICLKVSELVGKTFPTVGFKFPPWESWAHSGPFGPIGPIWAHLGPLGPFGPIGPIWAHWAHLSPFGPIWAHPLGPFGPIWPIGPIGPTLKYCPDSGLRLDYPDCIYFRITRIMDYSRDCRPLVTIWNSAMADFPMHFNSPYLVRDSG